MVTQAFRIDVSEVTKWATQVGTAAPKIVKDELVTAMNQSTQDVQDAATKRVNHRTGNYGRSFRRVTQVTASGIVGVISNAAASAKGFVYAVTLERGRGPVFAKPGRFLRFVIGGEVLFRKSVGPAPAQHIMEFGLRDAEPTIQGRFAAARDKIAARLEAL